MDRDLEILVIEGAFSLRGVVRITRVGRKPRRYYKFSPASLQRLATLVCNWQRRGLIKSRPLMSGLVGWWAYY